MNDQNSPEPTTQNMPAWVMTMRAAAQRLVKQEDIEAIVRNQVAAAKKGDRNAIKFVFEQVLAGPAPKGGSYVQNNFYGGETPAAPTTALPGTTDKVEAMRRRIAAGKSAFDRKDAERDSA